MTFASRIRWRYEWAAVGALVAVCGLPGTKLLATPQSSERAYVFPALAGEMWWPAETSSVPAHRAYLAVPVLHPPLVRFYADPALSGVPAIELNGRGIFLGPRAICMWAGTRPENAWLGSSPIGLVDATDRQTGCPGDVPIRYAGTAAHVEIARVNGTRAEIRFRGHSYYLNWRQVAGGMLHFPRKTPPFLGGLDVPAAFRPESPGRKFKLDLRAQPTGTSGIVATLTTMDLCDVFGIGNGTLLASVYGRTSGWSLLRLVDGRLGWLAPEDSGKFMSLERLVRLPSTYPTSEWDRRLHVSPGSAERFEVPHDPRRVWIGYLDRGQAPVRSAPLYSTPDRSEPPVAKMVEGDHLRVETVNPVSVPRLHYAIVFSTRPGWIELLLTDSSETDRKEAGRRVWLEDVPGRWVVRPVPPHEREGPLSEEWGGEGTSVDVLETRRVAGVLWLKVSVRAGEACEHDLTTLAEGWIPALTPNGRPMIWFEVCYA